MGRKSLKWQDLCDRVRREPPRRAKKIGAGRRSENRRRHTKTSQLSQRINLRAVVKAVRVLTDAEAAITVAQPEKNMIAHIAMTQHDARTQRIIARHRREHHRVSRDP